MNEFDVYLKDEGEFTTVIFQSKKAVDILKKDQVYQNNKKHFYGIKVTKLDIDNSSRSSMLRWAISHNLTMDSDTEIRIS